jgi:lipopolysaccharide transport system permease protein
MWLNRAMFHANLIYYLLKKEIKAVYVGSTLGAFWIILRPLLIIVVFWLVFSEIMKVRPYAGKVNIPYIFFMLSTIFFWFGFQESVMRSSMSVIEKGEIVKKVSMPIEVLPIVSVLLSYFNHLIGVLIFFAAAIFLYHPSALWLLVIPLTCIQIMFSMGLAFLFSALSVYVRDIPQIAGIVLQGMFFLTPIVYPIDIIPEKVRFLFYINPLTYFMRAYQEAIIYREFPNYINIMIICVLSVTTLFIGLKTFKKLKEGFADTL